jgi:sodium transport system ATP-binding protein
MQEVAAVCDEVVVIATGKVLACGTPDELRARAGTPDLEEAFVRFLEPAGQA